MPNTKVKRIKRMPKPPKTKAVHRLDVGEHFQVSEDRPVLTVRDAYRVESQQEKDDAVIVVTREKGGMHFRFGERVNMVYDA